MLPIETRKALGEITETEHRYGSYVMKVTWYRDADMAQVTVCDLAARLPLRWSRGLTKAQARGAIDLFEQIGFFEMA